MAKFSMSALLGLNSKAFQTGLANAQNSVGAFRGAVGKLAPVLGAVGLTQLARNAIDTGSRLSDLAVQVNINAEALQALSFSAQTAGVGQSTLQRALRNVQIRTEEAALGNKSYADALVRLGINLEDFRKLPTEEKFNAIAKAQANATDKQEAFNSVARILGERAGPELTEVLQDVAKNGFDSMKQSAKAAGQLMSDQTIKAMDDTSDRIAELKTRTTVLVAEGLNRAIGAFDMLKESLKMVGLQFAAGISTVIEFGSTLTNVVLGSVEHVVTAFNAVTAATKAAGQALTGNFKGAGESIKEARQLAGDAVDQFLDIPNKIGSEFSAMGDRLSDMNRSIEKDMEETADKVKEGFTRMTTGVVESSVGVGAQVAANVTPDLSAAFANASDVAGAVGGIKTASDSAKQSIEELNATQLGELQSQAQATEGAINNLESKIAATKQEILNLNTSDLDGLLSTFGVTAEEIKERVKKSIELGGQEGAVLSAAQLEKHVQNAIGNIRHELRKTKGELGEGVSAVMPTPAEISQITTMLQTVASQSSALAKAPTTIDSLTTDLKSMNAQLAVLKTNANNIKTEITLVETQTSALSSALEAKATEIQNIEIPDALGNVGDGTGGTSGIDLSAIGTKLDVSNGHLANIETAVEGKFVNQ